MNKIRNYIYHYYRYYKSRQLNVEVKNFVKDNVKNKEDCPKNVWSSNRLWDYYYHRNPEAQRSEYYVPYDYFDYKIQPVLNDKNYTAMVEDKNMYDRLYRGCEVQIPETVFRCYNNILMDANYNSISNLEEHLSKFKTWVFIKKAISSYGGKGVKKFRIENESVIDPVTNKILSLEDLIAMFGHNFVAQEAIRQHEKLGALHPSSINTIRVDSYRSVKTNKVHFLSASIRIGAKGSYLDNCSSGGMSVGLEVDDNFEARLKKYSLVAFTDKRISHHPDTGIEFNNYKIPGFAAIMNSIEKMSNVIPSMRVIAWDFSVDQFNQPVFIEMNKSGGIWGSQASSGKPFFKEFSQEVKDYIDSIN